METVEPHSVEGNTLESQRVVESFLDALNALDTERVQNVPLPPDRGKAQVERTLRAFGRFVTHFEVHTHQLAARDGVVLTERTDILRGPLIDISIWVCGTFEVKNGKITLWRDHFDLASFAAQLVVGKLLSVVRSR
jgi:limonene-1,2-epoxide hydrolase